MTNLFSHHDATAQTLLPRDPEKPGLMSRELCATLTKRFGLLDAWSHWTGDIRWARNWLVTASGQQMNRVGGLGFGTNQIDEQSITRAIVSKVSAGIRERLERGDNIDLGTGSGRGPTLAPPKIPYAQPVIWSEATYQQSAETRGAIASALTDSAERAGMLSAGYLGVTAETLAIRTNDDVFLYARRTIAQCSVTVRSPDGLGSGWAGASSYDWGRIDAPRLAQIALQKCLTSRNPKRIEPGRYTLIMEPQATAMFVTAMIYPPDDTGRQDESMGRDGDEDYQHPDNYPFYERAETIPATVGQAEIKIGISKLGQQLLDERLTISHDPADPDLGVIPFAWERWRSGEPVLPVTWFERGVLTTLGFESNYGRKWLRKDVNNIQTGAFRMSGGTTSLEEMIATTKRGLLVTRFWSLSLLDLRSLLYSGVTRDGLWLIENGKITYPVHNMRFTESPLFAFNNVEQLGVPVPVYSPGRPQIAPPVKVRDFSFTAMTDAV